MSLLTVILAILVCVLLWRLHRIRRVIGQIVDAADAATPVLLEHRSGLLEGYRLDSLVAAYNRLVTENASMTDAGTGYLDQIQTTLGNLREAVVMVDQSNRIRLANPAFSTLVGEGEAPVDCRLDNFIQGERFLEFLKEVREGGKGHRREIEVKVLNKEHWLEVSAANLEDSPQSEGPLTLFFFHDITRQKGLERMRTEFVANVSHELRTPVTVVRGFAQTLMDDEAILSPEEKRRFLQKILDNADRQHVLLKDLLLLSRLESTDMVLQLEALSLRTFMTDTAKGWGPVLKEKNRELKFQFVEGPDTVMADPLRMHQVLTNLFENTLRHARECTWIKLGTLSEGTVICMFIEDNGVGIPEKDLPHIFQRFYRVDKGRSRELGGTGLGLSIVKHIVVQHGGNILAKSQRGEGTRIEIRLPLHTDNPLNP